MRSQANNTQEILPELSQVILNLTKYEIIILINNSSNNDLKSKIEYLVKNFERSNTPNSNFGIFDGSQRLYDPLNRKPHKKIADPRIVQSSLGNPLLTAFPTSPDPSSLDLFWSVVPKLSPPRPLSVNMLRPDTAQSTYTIPPERKDVVKDIDAHVSAKMREVKQILEESSTSPKKKKVEISDTEKERIRSMIRTRLNEKKTKN